jgi:hypothetical protein
MFADERDELRRQEAFVTNLDGVAKREAAGFLRQAT